MAIPDNLTAGLAIDTHSVDDLRRAARERSPQALEAASKQFEALFLNMIMKSMRATTQQDQLFNNQQTRMYTSMLDKQLSQNFADRGVGLAEVLIRQLSSTLGTGQPTADDSGIRSNPAYSAHPAMWHANPWQSATAARRSADIADDSSQPDHVQAFLNRLQSHAEEASRSTGIPARFMLAQAALESGWGRHEIRAVDGSSSHNLFGIKATGNWNGKVVESVTTEYVGGVPEKRLEKFRAYDSYADAFRDYANLLRNNPRYKDVLANATDMRGFAEGLQQAGYATDPAYASKLMHIITENLAVS